MGKPIWARLPFRCPDWLGVFVHIIRLTPADTTLLNAAAHLHADNIEHGVLPLLGIPFLRSVYRGLTRGPNMGVWVALEDSRILGFVAGSADVQHAYARVARSDGPGLAVLAIRGLLSPRVLRRLPALLTYLAGPQERSHPDNRHRRAELLAMAVEPTARQAGVGRALVNTLETALRLAGECDEYYVTTNIDDPRSNNFYRRLGFEPVTTMRHHVLTLQVYRKNLLLGE